MALQRASGFLVRRGIGRELGRFAVEDYTERKTERIHLGGRSHQWLPR